MGGGGEGEKEKEHKLSSVLQKDVFIELSILGPEKS